MLYKKTYSSPRSLPINALITALVAMGQISTSVYIPSLPALTTELGSTVGKANLTLSLFLVGFGVAQLIYGPLSDRLGRRPVLLGGLVIYVWASVACAMAITIEMLIIARVLQAVGACAGPVVGRAVIRDLYEGDQTAKAMAYIGLALAISPAISPIIGGYLQVWLGWRANFVLLSGIGGAISLAVLFMLAETNPVHRSHLTRTNSLMGTYVTLLCSQVYLRHTLTVTFVFAGLMAYMAGAPYVFIDLMNLTPERFGMLAIFSVSGFAIGSLVAARSTAYVGQEKLMRLGLVAALVSGAIMTLLAQFGIMTIFAIVGPIMLFMVGLGIVMPLGIAGAMQPHPKIAGAASALLGCIQMTLSGMISALLGSLVFNNQMPMASIIFACAVGATVSYLVLEHKK